ncbi:MAG: TIGR00296 family protein [Candidatus Altiarchaeota archaeon]
MTFNHEQGRDIVLYARAVIEGNFKGHRPLVPDSLKGVFSEKRGVFVTMHKNHELRGCIGYPEPVLQLGLAVERAAVSSALEDPRFRPVRAEEMDMVSVEVSVLTKPQLIEVKDPKEYLSKVKVGRDGLIAERGMERGLLLPQVPVELNWDVEEFIQHTCAKAGLMPDEWTKKGFRLYSFSAQIFVEETPRGNIVERKINDHSPKAVV